MAVISWSVGLTYLNNNNKTYLLQYLPGSGERRKLGIEPGATRQELTSLSWGGYVYVWEGSHQSDFDL